MEPESIQESQYSVPYHYLPWEEDDIWRVGRFLWWGFEYLALLNTVIEMIAECLPAGRQVTVLDFGCGDGRLIVELLKRHGPAIRAIVGVDISERALTFAKAMTIDYPQVHLTRDVFHALREAGPFDIAVAMEVLEHVRPPELSEVVANIHASLAKEGALVVSVPTTNVPLNRKHYQHFTLNSLQQVLAGRFRLEECRFVHRVGPMEALIRRAVVNRFFVVNHKVWLKLWTALYKRFVLKADERTGAHMVCRFRKAGHHE